MNDVAETYRRRAEVFEALVAATPPNRWGAPSPCAGWTARDVVAHVVDFSAQVLAEKAGRPGPAFAQFDEPVDAFRATRQAVQSVLDDPGTNWHAPN